MKMRFFIIAVFSFFVMYAQDDAYNYEQIECTMIPIVRQEIHRAHPHLPGPRSFDKRAQNQATSTNWSGYVVANNFVKPSKNSVSAVQGSWIVPVLKPTPDDSYCALWVGIDGYNSPTVEQIGTSHNWINGAREDYAWFEMYPGSSYAIGGFPLFPGDVISASVVYAGNSIFKMTIYNHTQKVVTTIPTSYTKSTVAKRISAEWVMEAPYLNGILPLSNFVTAYMWGCTATINGITAPIGNKSWRNVPVAMVTNTGQLKDAISDLLPDKGSFFVTWLHE